MKLGGLPWLGAMVTGRGPLVAPILQEGLAGLAQAPRLRPTWPAWALGESLLPHSACFAYALGTGLAGPLWPQRITSSAIRFGQGCLRPTCKHGCERTGGPLQHALLLKDADATAPLSCIKRRGPGNPANSSRDKLVSRIT